MDEMKIEYKRLNDELIVISRELQELEKDEKISRYNKLKRRNELLLNHQFELYKQLKMQKIANCNHIFICSEIDYNNIDGHSSRKYACVKCGLDNSIIETDKELLSFDDQIMYDFLKHNKEHIKGKVTNIHYDLTIARHIYANILEDNPNISDDEAISLLEEFIREIKKPEERKYEVLPRVYSSQSKIGK